MRRFEAILFDCDGVLIDSEPPGCAALARAVTEAGVPMTQAEAMAAFSGSAATETRAYMASLGLDAAAVFAESDRILFRMFDREVPHIPGIATVLETCRVPVAICSNSSMERLRRSILRTPLARHFGGHVYSADHVPAAKPAPDLALFAAARLGVAPERAVFIDDNIHGIRCAVQAGCLAVGFIGPSDHRPAQAQTLRDAGADHVVHGMAGFRALLDRLLVKHAA